MSSLSRASDTFYAFRFARLMQQDFTDWTAYKLGLIDEKGKNIRPAKTNEEKSVWTRFHMVVRNLKNLIGYVPGGSFGLKYGASYALLKEIQTEYSLSEHFFDCVESVLAGDSNGDVDDIASGVNSGSVTSAGPIMTKVKKKKPARLNEVAGSIAQLYRILDELGRTSIYNQVADIAAGFDKNPDKTVSDIIKIVSVNKQNEDYGYTLSNLKAFKRRLS